MSETLPSVPELIKQLASSVAAHLDSMERDAPLVVGIHTGGVWVAEALREELNIESPLGTLNINFYRDDFSRIGLHPRVTPSSLPFEIEDRHIILVDDVLVHVE